MEDRHGRTDWTSGDDHLIGGGEDDDIYGLAATIDWRAQTVQIRSMEEMATVFDRGSRQSADFFDAGAGDDIARTSGVDDRGYGGDGLDTLYGRRAATC